MLGPMGTAAAAGGRVGVQLEDKDRVNAGIVAPQSGAVNIYIIVSASQPRPNTQIYRGFCKGRGTFAEHWDPQSGLTNISINQPDTYHTVQVFSGIYLNEGEFLAIRITNRTEGYNFNLASIYMEYQ